MAPSARASAATDSAHIAAELTAVNGRLVRRLRAESTVPPHHLTALGRLRRDGPQTTSGLAARERIRPQSMAQTIADLVAGGLVTRRDDPDDGRKILLEITDRGEAVLENEHRARASWLAAGIERHLDDDERAVLHQAVALIDGLLDR